MQLTPKQEAFCLAYLETGNASEAYRQSYDCVTANAATVTRKAKALIDMDKIGTRLEELRKPVIERAQITLETHLNDLKALRDEAKFAGQYSAAISAEVSRGKASGLYVDKIKVDQTVRSNVMLVPSCTSVDEWEKAATAQQSSDD